MFVRHFVRFFRVKTFETVNSEIFIVAVFSEWRVYCQSTWVYSELLNPSGEPIERSSSWYDGSRCPWGFKKGYIRRTRRRFMSWKSRGLSYDKFAVLRETFQDVQAGEIKIYCIHLGQVFAPNFNSSFNILCNEQGDQLRWRH